MNLMRLEAGLDLVMEIINDGEIHTYIGMNMIIDDKSLHFG